MVIPYSPRVGRGTKVNKDHGLGILIQRAQFRGVFCCNSDNKRPYGYDCKLVLSVEMMEGNVLEREQARETTRRFLDYIKILICKHFA